MSRTSITTRLRVKRVIVWGFLVLFSLGILELSSFVVLRVLAEQPNPTKAQPHLFDPFRGHRLNSEYELPKWTYGERVHSQDGFRRDDSVALRKEPGVVRIIMLGGSALYGAGSTSGKNYPYHPVLRNNETISYYLEGMINSRFRLDGIARRAEVINAGVIGYHTFNELVYLNASLLDYEPDWVISFDGNNDFYGQIPGINDWSSSFYSTRILVDLTNQRSFFLPIYTAIRAIAPYSNFFSLAEKVSNQNFQRITGEAASDLAERQNVLWPSSVTGHSIGAGQVPADWRGGTFEYARETYIRSLVQVARLGELEGFEHVVFLQPQIVFEDDEHLNEHDREMSKITKENVHKNWLMMRRVRTLFPEIFYQNGLVFHDLGDIGRFNHSGDDLYLDYTHLTPAGSEIVAQRIFDEIYPSIVSE